MFLSLLSTREKVAFLALAKKVIVSDRIIAQSEMVRFKSMKQELEIMDELVDEKINESIVDNLPDNIPELCSEFVAKKTKVSALMELIGLGYVDGKFVQEEREIIYQIAHYFGIRKMETDSYIDWASRLYY